MFKETRWLLSAGYQLTLRKKRNDITRRPWSSIGVETPGEEEMGKIKTVMGIPHNKGIGEHQKDRRPNRLRREQRFGGGLWLRSHASRGAKRIMSSSSAGAFEFCFLQHQASTSIVPPLWCYLIPG